MSNGQTRSGVLQGARVIVFVIYAILMTYVTILMIAFFLRLFGANPTASFVEWIYTAAARIMQPFRGMFPTQQVTSKSVFDASLLFAVIMYWLGALLLHAVVDWLSDRIYDIKQRQLMSSYPQPTLTVPAPSPEPSAYRDLGAAGSPAYGDAGSPSPRR